MNSEDCFLTGILVAIVVVGVMLVGWAFYSSNEGNLQCQRAGWNGGTPSPNPTCYRYADGNEIRRPLALIQHDATVTR